MEAVAVRGSGDEEEARRRVEQRLATTLKEALLALARSGDADHACRLAARLWADVRADRPELAVTLTALLHRLVRSAVDDAAPADARQRQ